MAQRSLGFTEMMNLRAKATMSKPAPLAEEPWLCDVCGLPTINWEMRHDSPRHPHCIIDRAKAAKGTGYDRVINALSYAVS